MPALLQANSELPNGHNLFISLLVCYPQIGTVTFNPHDKTLELTFMLSSNIVKEAFDADIAFILNSLDCYHTLEHLTNAVTNIHSNTFDKVIVLTIIRDIKTLSKNEIGLIVALIQQKFVKLLIPDTHEQYSEEDLVFQEQLIENTLLTAKEWSREYGLIGIRDEGRVMVFNT